MNREATDLAGVRHEKFETLGSTNAEALARARAGEHGPLWISSVSQTAGRGRRGSIWTSPPGNLYATLLLTEPSPQAVAPQLCFVSGLALHDAVTACAAKLTSAVKLKWPNDLLLSGRKVAGLLIEAESQPVFAVAIGFGVNCKSHPDGTSFPSTDFRVEGAVVDPDELLSALATSMSERLGQWAGGDGFISIRADWLERAGGLGEPIKVRLPDRQLGGIFEGIDESGKLMLGIGSRNSVAIAAGEVFSLGIVE